MHDATRKLQSVNISSQVRRARQRKITFDAAAETAERKTHWNKHEISQILQKSQFRLRTSIFKYFQFLSLTQTLAERKKSCRSQFVGRSHRDQFSKRRMESVETSSVSHSLCLFVCHFLCFLIVCRVINRP